MYYSVENLAPIKYYTGIGSRETPDEIMALMKSIARKLEVRGFHLRSGGADGADTAFADGVKNSVNKTIFIPWNRFNDHTENGMDVIVPPLNLETVKKYHPAYNVLSNAAKKLMSRNYYQIQGIDNQPISRFVVCYTKDGLDSGGTGQALRVARDNNVPVFNLFSVFDKQELLKKIQENSL